MRCSSLIPSLGRGSTVTWHTPQQGVTCKVTCQCTTVIVTLNLDCQCASDRGIVSIRYETGVPHTQSRACSRTPYLHAPAGFTLVFSQLDDRRPRCTPLTQFTSQACERPQPQPILGTATPWLQQRGCLGLQPQRVGLTLSLIHI